MLYIIFNDFLFLFFILYKMTFEKVVEFMNGIIIIIITVINKFS